MTYLLFILFCLTTAYAIAPLKKPLTKTPEPVYKIEEPQPHLTYRTTRTVSHSLSASSLLPIFKSMFIGVDGRYSLPTSESTVNYGPVLGVQLSTRMPARIWVGSNIPDLRRSKHDGIRIGTGVKIGMISLNIEFQQNKFKQFESDFLSQNPPSNNSTVISLYSLIL